MKFLLTCAGTAGHINPAISIADSLKKRVPDAEFLFIGSGREMENRLIPMAGYPIKNISSSGLERGDLLKNLLNHARAVLDLGIGYAQADKIIREFKPDAVIGTGGYVCFPVIRSAHRRRIPTFLHESNAVPGLTTRMLSKTVDSIFVAFPGLEQYYKLPERVTVTGTPVRGAFSDLSQEQAKAELGLTGQRLVVSFWGSLGAAACNQSSAEAVILNERSAAFRQIHATGGGDEGYRAFCSMLEQSGLSAQQLAYTDLRPYIDNMPVAMKAADLILCRSGASTLGELTAIGKPAVLVPSPYVADNHQEKNALRMVDAGGAVMLKEAELTGELLYQTITNLLNEPEKLQAMSASMGRVGMPESAEYITDLVLKRTGMQ